MKTINWVEKLGRGNKYTYKELLRKISPQSTTAEYIIQDLLTNGIIKEQVNKVYQVII